MKAHDEPDTDEQHTSQKSVADVFNESTSSTRSSNEPQPQLDVGEEAPASESAPADDATKEDVQVSSGAETPGQLSSLQPDLHSRAVSETVSEMPSDIPDIDELPSATPSRIVSVSQQVSDPSLLVQAGQVDAAQDLTQSDPSVPAFKIDEQMSEPRYDDAPAYDWGSRDNALPALPKEPPSPALSTDSNGQPKKSVPMYVLFTLSFWCSSLSPPTTSVQLDAQGWCRLAPPLARPNPRLPNLKHIVTAPIFESIL